jgi:hypothetical protein
MFHWSVAKNNIMCKFNSAPNSYTGNKHFNDETVSALWCSSSSRYHPLLCDQKIVITCSILCSPFLPYSFPANLLLILLVNQSYIQVLQQTTSKQRQQVPHSHFHILAHAVSCVRIQKILNKYIFIGWGCQPHTQPLTRRTRVSLFVWVITLDLASMGCHTSIIATASIGLRVIWPHKPHHYVKVGIPSVGYNSYKSTSIVLNTQNNPAFSSFCKWNCSTEEGANGTHFCKCCLY